jgi:plastocyanin
MMRDQQQNSTALGSYRRDLMKAIGAGTAVGMLGGVATADEHDDESDDAQGEQAAEGTVHVVRTLVRESTNPERPADFFYQPTGLHIDPGDVVKFVFETPDHTVTSYHPAFGMQRRLPAGVQPFSSPIMGWDPQSLPDDIDMPPEEGGEEMPAEADASDEDGENVAADEENTESEEDGPRPSTWLHVFETAGVYDLECAPHEGFGMAMRVVVGEETETSFETSDVDELPPPRAGPVGLAREVLTDAALEPDSIVDAGRIEWQDLDVNTESE